MKKAGMQFDFSFAKPQGARRVDDEEPFRMLVLADLGGAATRPFAQRKPLSVDIDNFDAVFGRIAPRLELALDDATLTIEFGSFDDFHPDRLFARLAPFVALRQLRAELADPAQFRRAAAALGATPVAASVSTQAADAADANDIERLLGRKPAAHGRCHRRRARPGHRGLAARHRRAACGAGYRRRTGATDRCR